MFELRLEFHLSLFLMVQLKIRQHLFSYMTWRRKGDKPLPEPIMTQFKVAYMSDPASMTRRRAVSDTVLYWIMLIIVVVLYGIPCCIGPY